MPSQMASSTDHGLLVVSSNLTSTMKTLFKEKATGKRLTFCQYAFTNGVVDRPWVVGREFESHVQRPMVLPTTPFVKALVRWATGKRLTNRLPKLSLITHNRVISNHSRTPLAVIRRRRSAIPLLSRYSRTVWEVEGRSTFTTKKETFNHLQRCGDHFFGVFATC